MPLANHWKRRVLCSDPLFLFFLHTTGPFYVCFPHLFFPPVPPFPTAWSCPTCPRIPWEPQALWAAAHIAARRGLTGPQTSGTPVSDHPGVPVAARPEPPLVLQRGDQGVSLHSLQDPVLLYVLGKLPALNVPGSLSRTPLSSCSKVRQIPAALRALAVAQAPPQSILSKNQHDKTSTEHTENGLNPVTAQYRLLT